MLLYVTGTICMHKTCENVLTHLSIHVLRCVCVCVFVCAKVSEHVFRSMHIYRMLLYVSVRAIVQQQDLGLTVLINISIMAELSRRVEHLSSSQFNPPILSSICLSLLPSLVHFHMLSLSFPLSLLSLSHSGDTEMSLAVYTG